MELVEDLEDAMEKLRLLDAGAPQLQTFWQGYAVSQLQTSGMVLTA
jgi:hypothetical protein